MAPKLNMNDVAFTIDNIAYVFHFVKPAKGTQLMGKTFSPSAPTDKRLTSDTTPNKAELDIDEDGHHGVWVGMYNREYMPQKTDTKGVATSNWKKTPGFDDNTAWRVIVQCNGAQANCYALANPDDFNVCIGYKIKVDFAPFFVNYRDDDLTSVGSQVAVG